MVWQDLVISGILFLFVASLLPSIFSAKKPNAWTSLMGVFGALILAFVFSTVELWVTVAAEVAMAIEWGVLFMQVLGGGE